MISLKFVKKRKSSETDSPVDIPPDGPGPGEAPPVTEYENLQAAAHNENSIWRDPWATRLLSTLLSGQLTEIRPVIGSSDSDGFTYGQADVIMETSGKSTLYLLEALVREGFLLKEDFEKVLMTPEGSIRLIPVERCPSCDSPHLVKGRMIEHFNCGYVGLETEFNSGPKSVCPKCKKKLKLIGTDYRNPGFLYSCQHCHGVFPTPTIKCRCLKTGKVYNLEELDDLWLYSYRLNDQKRKILEFELEPKRMFLDYLHDLGYTVQEGIKLKGRSGASHTIDLFASMDDPIANHEVAIGILAAPPDVGEVALESLFSFDSKVYDAGIRHKIVLAIPQLSVEAYNFAKRQEIRVYGVEQLRRLLSRQPESREILPTGQERQEIDPELACELGNRDRHAYLKQLLENKGYQVTRDAKIMGRSGAELVLDFYAEKDDGIVSHRLCLCIIEEQDDTKDIIDEVVRFDTAAYDAGISDKIIIAIPGLYREARQFAEYQNIKIIEAGDLIKLSRRCFGGDDTGPAME